MKFCYIFLHLITLLHFHPDPANIQRWKLWYFAFDRKRDFYLLHLSSCWLVFYFFHYILSHYYIFIPIQSIFYAQSFSLIFWICIWYIEILLTFTYFYLISSILCLYFICLSFTFDILIPIFDSQSLSLKFCIW